MKALILLHLLGSISSKLCEEKNCGDTCGISPFGPKYCTKDKTCIGMPWGGPDKEDCDGIVLLSIGLYAMPTLLEI